MSRRGINRPEIESLLRSEVIRLTGFPPDNVFFSEHAADTTACPRPCVSMTLMPYETMQRTGDVYRFPSLEFWRAAIESSADGTYSLTIDGATYSHNAVGQTPAQIRYSLLAVVNGGAHPNFTAVSAGTASIDIESQSPGRRLAVSASVGLGVAYLRSDVVKVVKRSVELRLEIECVGVYGNPPDVAFTGVDIAERLMHALLDEEETAAMRRAGHPITTARTTDARRVVDGQEETVGVIDAILGTVSTHISTLVGSGREASVTVEVQ